MKVGQYAHSSKIFLAAFLLGFQFFSTLEAKIKIDYKKFASSLKPINRTGAKIVYVDSLIQPKKANTVLVYMAADNNLSPFVRRALLNLQDVGSNENLNILVHLNIRTTNKPKVTKKLFIEKGRIIQIGPDESLNSGSAKTCNGAFEWAIKNFPSESFFWFPWNHGAGELSPRIKRIFDPSLLFKYNPKTKKAELDRSINFSDFLEWHNANKRIGVCFDDTYSDYLDDNKLDECLGYACELLGKKIDVIAMDTCFMAGAATMFILSKHSTVVLCSEEAVLGPGYNHKKMLSILTEGKIDPEEYGRVGVAGYYETYGEVTDDYTHSALRMEKFDDVHNNIDILSELLIEAIRKQKKNSVKNAIKKARSMTVCFDEPSYIDFCDFLKKLLKEIPKIKLKNKKETYKMIAALTESINRLVDSIEKELVIVNVVGKNLKDATGFSTY